MSIHAIPSDVDIELLVRLLPIRLRAQSGVVFGSGLAAPPTALEFSPDLTAGEETTLAALIAEVVRNSGDVLTWAGDAYTPDTPVGGAGVSVTAGSYAGRPSPSAAGNLHLPTDAPYVLRDTGSAWQAWGPLRQLVIPPETGWSWLNQGGASIDTTGGAHVLTSPASARIRYRVRAAPATPYVITALLVASHLNTSFQLYGAGFRDSATDRIQFVAWHTRMSGGHDSAPALTRRPGRGRLRVRRYGSAISRSRQIFRMSTSATSRCRGTGAVLPLRGL